MFDAPAIEAGLLLGFGLVIYMLHAVFTFWIRMPMMWRSIVVLDA